MTTGQRVFLLWLVATFLAGPFMSHLHKALGSQSGDWLSIYNIGLHSLHTGELRADTHSSDIMTERFPPIARPLLMLMALPPKTVSAVLSFLLFTFLYTWCALRLSDLFLQPSPGRRWAGAALLAALVGPYLWADLTACNLTSVLLWSVTAGFVLTKRGRPISGGIALSVGILLKMIPAVCLVYFLVRRQWRLVWGTLFGVVALGLLPSLMIFGAPRLREYFPYWYHKEFTKVAPMRVIDEQLECGYPNQAVVRTLVRLFTHTNAGSSEPGTDFFITVARLPAWGIKLIYLVVMGASGAAFLWLLWRGRADSSPYVAPCCYALCVGAMVWFTPYAGSYYFPLAMWPAAALMGTILREPHARASRVAAIGLIAWLVLMPTLASPFLRALGTSMAGLLLLLIACAWYLAAESNQWRSDHGG